VPVQILFTEDMADNFTVATLIDFEVYHDVDMTPDEAEAEVNY
jgi:hypothetical protein